MTDQRHHLHLKDHPATLTLLAALLTGRGRIPNQVARIGYTATEHGAWVDWDSLSRSWLSSTEQAVVHLARGCAVIEGAGGLPAHLEAPVLACIQAVIR